MDDHRDFSSFSENLPAAGSLRCHYCLDLDWKGFRSLSLQDRGRFLRGVYRIHSYKLKVEEGFSFFQYNLTGDERTPLLVYPSLNETESRVQTAAVKAETVNSDRSILKDRSFFESRLYYPGDDPRRINWKLKARYGELFVKEGYVTRPAGKSVLILINASGAMEQTDKLVRESGYLMSGLLSSRAGFSVYASGQESAMEVQAGTAIEWIEDFLAAIPPLPLDSARLPDIQAYGAVYLFSDTSHLPESSAFLSREGAGRKRILILTGEDAAGGNSGRLKAYQAGGWHVVIL